MTTKKRQQFSIRAILVLTFATAVLAASGRVLGMDWLVATTVVLFVFGIFFAMTF